MSLLHPKNLKDIIKKPDSQKNPFERLIIACESTNNKNK